MLFDILTTLLAYLQTPLPMESSNQQILPQQQPPLPSPNAPIEVFVHPIEFSPQTNVLHLPQ